MCVSVGCGDGMRKSVARGWCCAGGVQMLGLQSTRVRVRVWKVRRLCVEDTDVFEHCDKCAVALGGRCFFFLSKFLVLAPA